MEPQQDTPIESPIQNLPNDILYEVLLAAHDYIFYETRAWAVAPWNQTAFLPRTIGLVCSAWYKVVLASPKLWASVVISHYTKTEMIEVSIQRSSGAPLRLYICTEMFGTLNVLIRNILRPYLHRCISIVHNDKASDGHILVWSNYHKSLNAIIHLDLMKRPNQRTGTVCKSELVTLPSLNRLDVNIRDIQQPEPLAIGLTTLHVQLDHLDILAIFKCLRSAQNLKTLAIYGDFDRSSLDSNSITDIKPQLFPQLLSLFIFSVNDFLFFIGLIDAPHLQDVTILQMNPSHLHPQESEHALPRQLKSLTIPPFERLTMSVTMTRTTYTENRAPALFKSFPHVKDVTFGGIFGILPALQEIAKPPFDDKWPALQSVAVEPGRTYSFIDATYQLIKSRSAAGIPLREIRYAHDEEILARFKNEDWAAGIQVPIFRESTAYREAIRECIYR